MFLNRSHISMVKGELVPMLVNKKVEIMKKQKLANSGHIGLDDFPAGLLLLQ